MNQQIDWTKPVQTSEFEPKPLRVLCTDASNPTYPVICMLPDGSSDSWCMDGRYLAGKESTLDAENAW